MPENMRWPRMSEFCTSNAWQEEIFHFLCLLFKDSHQYPNFYTKCRNLCYRIDRITCAYVNSHLRMIHTCV